jgi:hypothetical protein
MFGRDFVWAIKRLNQDFQDMLNIHFAVLYRNFYLLGANFLFRTAILWQKWATTGGACGHLGVVYAFF